MIEMTWIPEALRALAGIYIAIGLIALMCALALPKSRLRKACWSAAVLVVWILIPKLIAPPASTPEQVKDKQRRLVQIKAAEVRFQTICKTAGERIDRTVEGVDGLLLMKIRPEAINQDNQFAMDDPYGRRGSGGGESFIKSFLVETYNASKNKGTFEPKERTAYRYVDVIDESANRYRYTVKFVLRNPKIFKQGEGDYVLVKEDAMRLPSPRYGVTWDDISTKEDRELWIAGGSIKIFDLKENRVIAERRGYMIDRAQGSTAGFRSPWGAASQDGWSCPTWKEHHLPFVSKVLKRNVN
jgi:hypothetical protein